MRKKEESGEPVFENKQNEIEKPHISATVGLKFPSILMNKKSKEKVPKSQLMYQSCTSIWHSQLFSSEDVEVDILRNRGIERQIDFPRYQFHTPFAKTKTPKNLINKPLFDPSTERSGTLGEAETAICYQC